MARPLKPRTAFARRLIDVREAAGFENRADFAELLGIPTDTLGSYERGVAEPGVALLAQYRELLGVNLSWLITNEGDMFEADRSGTYLRHVKDRAFAQLDPLPDLSAETSGLKEEHRLDLLEMFTLQRTQEEVLLGKIAAIVNRAYQEANYKVSFDGLINVVVRQHKRLLQEKADLSDDEEIDAKLKIIDLRIRKFLGLTKENPGLSKRSASSS